MTPTEKRDALLRAERGLWLGLSSKYTRTLKHLEQEGLCKLALTDAGDRDQGMKPRVNYDLTPTGRSWLEANRILDGDRYRGGAFRNLLP